MRPLMLASEPVSGPFIKHRMLSGESASTLGPFSNTYLTPRPRPPMYLRAHSSGMGSYLTLPAVKSTWAIRLAYPPNGMTILLSKNGFHRETDYLKHSIFHSVETASFLMRTMRAFVRPHAWITAEMKRRYTKLV